MTNLTSSKNYRKNQSHARAMADAALAKTEPSIGENIEVADIDGVVTHTYQPAVFPLHYYPALFRIRALKTSRLHPITKGENLWCQGIYGDGRIAVSKTETNKPIGLLPMADFVELLKVPIDEI